MATPLPTETKILLTKLADATKRTPAAIRADALAHYVAGENAIVEMIARGQADALESRVTPSETVARRAGVMSAWARTKPAQRAVVWTNTGRDGFVDSLRLLAGADPKATGTIASWILGAADQLGETAVGAPSRLPFPYEKAVPGLAYVLVFEIVTWTKAGEVIAILHLIDETRDRPREELL